MNSYPCLTETITTFYSLSDSDTAIGECPSIILIMLVLTFFFNKKIMCMLLVSIFMANASSSIMKSVICFFPCLNVLIFHLASAALLLLLNAVLTSLTKLS